MGCRLVVARFVQGPAAAAAAAAAHHLPWTPPLCPTQCPNGKECKYRHALPPGYVLKSQMKELLELEAANVSTG